jgi:nitronate monooxygenase
LTEIPLIVQAPMAGGPSTPELAAAVCNAGGLGFLAAAYKPPDGVRDDLRALRAQTDRPFGLNILSVVEPPVDTGALARYVAELQPEAERHGVTLPEPVFSDDDRSAKLALAAEERPDVVSFAFACPSDDEVEELHRAGSRVWITVTEPDEAVAAREVGADALVVQGIEAGGHRGSFTDEDGRGEIGLLALLRLVAGEVDLPLVAAGAIMDRAGVEAARAAGATAVQLGTAFLLCPEAGTPPAHRAALKTMERTAITRAFTGRRARGLTNRFLREHPDAPSAYPQIATLTGPIRAAARAADDGDGFQLWAGQGFRLAREIPAEQVVADLSR